MTIKEILRRYESDNSSLKAENEKLKKENDALLRKNARAENELVSLKSLLDATDVESVADDESICEINDLKSKIDDLNAEIEDLKRELDESNGILSETRDELTKMIAENESLKAKKTRKKKVTKE